MPDLNISRTPMPDLNNLDQEDEYSHRIDTDADGEEEDDVMITEVEKATNERLEGSRRNTFREDSDEEFVTHELFEDESNNKKSKSKGSSKYLISTKKP